MRPAWKNRMFQIEIIADIVAKDEGPWATPDAPPRNAPDRSAGSLLLAAARPIASRNPRGITARKNLPDLWDLAVLAFLR